MPAHSDRGKLGEVGEICVRQQAEKAPEFIQKIYETRH